MNAYPDTTYFNDVQETIANLRNYLLGLSLSFSDILPAQFKSFPNNQKAEHLADRIVFILTSLKSSYAACVPDLHDWLYNIILFLMETCRTEDHILANIIKLGELRLGNRELLFDKWGEGQTILSTAPTCPVDKFNLERALCILVAGAGVPYPGKNLLSQINNELKGNANEEA